MEGLGFAFQRGVLQGQNQYGNMNCDGDEDTNTSNMPESVRT